MFVHNSGAGDAIHLFAMWCKVLQNMDERQSAAEMRRCVTVSNTGGRMRQMNEAERDFENERQKTKG